MIQLVKRSHTFINALLKFFNNFVICYNNMYVFKYFHLDNLVYQ